MPCNRRFLLTGFVGLLACSGLSLSIGCGGGSSTTSDITTGVRGRAYDYLSNPSGKPKEDVGAPFVVYFYRLADANDETGTMAGEAIVDSNNLFQIELSPGLYRVDGPWYRGFGVSGNVCFDGPRRVEVRAGVMTQITALSRDICRI